MHLCPTDAPATDHLRLLLGGLHYLATGQKEPLLIKAVVEGRLLSLEGYMPDLTGCCRCGEETLPMWFSPAAGTLTCAHHAGQEDALEISAGVLAALRHVLYGSLERCFAFSLPAGERAALATIVERFLMAQQQHRYQTLEFYHTLRSEGISL